LSKEVFELRFAVNYLAGFLLTRLLLPRIRKSAPAGIVNVSSLGQQRIDFSFDLAQELAATGAVVNCLPPATYMDTTMVG
jgi:NAD(P)-dependent dehydrogenase (short-subunit alcohol dehydrogenase family)